MPTKYRIVIYLYYYEGYKVNEIAEILKVNSSTIQTRLTRGRQKLKKVFENIHASQKSYDIIMNKTIYNPTKKHIPKFAIIAVVLVTLTGFSFGVASVREFVVNIHTKSSDDGTFKRRNEKLTLTITKKVKIKKHSELSCEDALNYYNIENNLGINLINYNPINKYEQEQCEIYKDEKGNIRRIRIYYNDEYTSDLINRNNKDNSYDNKKYLSLVIEFMTNYATHEDEEYFKEKTIIKTNNVMYGSNSSNDIEKSRIEDELLEDYHINRFNIDAKIVNWYSNNSKIEKVDRTSTFCFFVYDGVYYSFMSNNMSKDEFINILENLEL